MGTVRAVLFDAAGTLIELVEPVGERYARRAREFGAALPASRIEEAFRRILRAAPPMVFPDAPATRIPELERAWWRAIVRGTFRAADGSVRFADFEGLFGALWADFADGGSWRLRGGARAALRRARDLGLRVGVVSNFDHRLPAILEALGIKELLDLVMLPGEARAAKPDPAIFRAALTRLGVDASEAIYVGDDAARDLAGAAAAGLRAIGVDRLATLDPLPEILATWLETA